MILDLTHPLNQLIAGLVLLLPVLVSAWIAISTFRRSAKKSDYDDLKKRLTDEIDRLTAGTVVRDLASAERDKTLGQQRIEITHYFNENTELKTTQNIQRLEIDKIRVENIDLIKEMAANKVECLSRITALEAKLAASPLASGGSLPVVLSGVAPDVVVPMELVRPLPMQMTPAQAAAAQAAAAED